MFERAKRVAKSFSPNLFKSRERYYNFDDARMAITDMGLAIPATMFEKLLASDEIMDDFIDSLYEVEVQIDVKEILTDASVIDAKFEPKAEVEGDKVAFSLVSKGERWIFAEYTVS
jgi:hypothetical protein